MRTNSDGAVHQSPAGRRFTRRLRVTRRLALGILYQILRVHRHAADEHDGATLVVSRVGHHRAERETGNFRECVDRLPMRPTAASVRARSARDGSGVEGSRPLGAAVQQRRNRLLQGVPKTSISGTAISQHPSCRSGTVRTTVVLCHRQVQLGLANGNFQLTLDHSPYAAFRCTTTSADQGKWLDPRLACARLERCA